MTDAVAFRAGFKSILYKSRFLHANLPATHLFQVLCRKVKNSKFETRNLDVEQDL